MHSLLPTFPPSSPPQSNFLCKAKKSWGWFGCSQAEVFWCSHTPNSGCLLKTHLITPPTRTISFPKTFPSSREAKAFRKRSPSCVLCRGPPKTVMHQGRDIWGGSEGAAVTWVGNKTLSILLQRPKCTCSTPGAFWGLPGPGRLWVFVPLCPWSCSGA